MWSAAHVHDRTRLSAGCAPMHLANIVGTVSANSCARRYNAAVLRALSYRFQAQQCSRRKRRDRLGPWFRQANTAQRIPVTTETLSNFVRSQKRSPHVD